MKKKKITCLLLAVVLILNLAPLNSAMAVQKVKLNKSKITLKVNQTKIIKITGTSQKVKWKNGNKKVLKVLTTNKKSIKIKAIREGKTQITAQVGKKKYYCKITIKKATNTKEDFDFATTAPTTTPTVTVESTTAPTTTPTVTVEPTVAPTPVVKKITSIVLDKTALIIDLGDYVALQAKVYPEDTTESREVSWSSSDTSVATVEEGIVTAIGVGCATITAKAGDQQANCVVNVKQTNGSISGNVTYYYNKFKGNVSDTGSLVLLIPMDGSALEASVVSSYVEWMLPSTINEKYNKYKVYEAKVDGMGGYSLQNIPVGKYKIIITSENTTSKMAFDNKEEYISSIQSLTMDVLSSENAKLLGQSVGLSKVLIDEIEITKDKNTIFSHDFGITYI